MNYLPLSQVKRRGVETLAPLLSASSHESTEAAKSLIGDARRFGLNLRDYLELAIDVPGSENPDRFRDAKGFLGGYEASLSYLNLPIKDDFRGGIVLDAASDTFQTYAGTRALFPAVVDDMVQWRYRQEQLESTTALVAQSRTISGIEMITTVVNDDEDDYQVVRPVAELGRIPVKTIRTGEQAVKFYKHGGGYRVSYEFQRRVRLDLLTPFQNRMMRELERSKSWAATGVMINGDGVNPAAGVVAQSSLDSGATSGTLSYKGLLKWFVDRARAGTPIDKVAGNWDAYLDWLMLFAIPTSNLTRTDAENLAATGFRVGGVPILNGTINFALSTAMPDNQLLGFSQGDTLEELIEGGSSIDESERAIQNQSITYVKTENAGYKLAFPDTRSIYNYGA